jgi:GAF domain-containing protein
MTDAQGTGRLVRDLEERLELIATLRGVARVTPLAPGIPELLRVLAAEIRLVCPYDRMSIAVADTESEVFHVPFIVLGGRVLKREERPRAFGETVIGEVYKTGRPSLREQIVNEGADPAYASDVQFQQLGFATDMVLPMKIGKQPIGTLNVACYDAGKLTARHQALLEDITPALATAIWANDALILDDCRTIAAEFDK